MLKCHIMVLKFRMRTEVSGEAACRKLLKSVLLKPEAFVNLKSSLSEMWGLSEPPWGQVAPGHRAQLEESRTGGTERERGWWSLWESLPRGIGLVFGEHTQVKSSPALSPRWAWEQSAHIQVPLAWLCFQGWKMSTFSQIPTSGNVTLETSVKRLSFSHSSLKFKSLLLTGIFKVMSISWDRI